MYGIICDTGGLGVELSTFFDAFPFIVNLPAIVRQTAFGVSPFPFVRFNLWVVRTVIQMTMLCPTLPHLAGRKYPGFVLQIRRELSDFPRVVWWSGESASVRQVKAFWVAGEMVLFGVVPNHPVSAFAPQAFLFDAGS